MEARLLTTQETMEILKIKDRGVFREIIKENKIPIVKHLKKGNFYDIKDINKFINSQKIL